MKVSFELVARELVHEIAAFDDFCAFRKARPKTETSAKLEARRKALHGRMRRRRRREREIGRHSRVKVRQLPYPTLVEPSGQAEQISSTAPANRPA